MKTIVFQGDSITDFNRCRDRQDNSNDPAQLGTGYVNLTAAQLLFRHPTEDLKCYNRGIGGHRVVDLYARWKTDTLNFNPDVITILIGVNDHWHKEMNNNGVDLERFETIYRLLLDWTFRDLPSVKVILMAPFTILGNGPVTPEFAAEVAKYAAVVEKIATDYNLPFIPLQKHFDEALKTFSPSQLAPDGIHPSPAGHTVIANALLEKLSF